MSRLSRLAKALLGAGVGAGYAWAMVRRNRRLDPPPMQDQEGRPYPECTFHLSDGEEIRYVDVGEGPTLLLVPGADGVKETFRYQLSAFAEEHRVIAADLRSRFPPDADFDLFARDLRELTDTLDADPAVVVGQSLGGAIAMRYAVRHPERVRGLVLCNTLARVSYEHVGLNRALLAPVAMATTRYLPTFLAQQAARLWSRGAVWIYDDAPGSENVVDYALWTGPRTASPRVSDRRVDLLKGEDLRPELAEIRVPTLVVKGPRDAYVPPEWSREIAGRIPGAAYVEVPETGHCSHISMPGRFNRLVLDWLAGVEAREGDPSPGAGEHPETEADPGEGDDRPDADGGGS